MDTSNDLPNVKYVGVPDGDTISRTVLIQELERCRIENPKTEFEDGINQGLAYALGRVTHISSQNIKTM